MGSESEETTLGEIVKNGKGVIQTGPFGSQLHASDYVVEGIPVLMPANIAGNRVDLSNIARINQSDADRLSKHIVKVGDIVYSRRGDVTKKALITKSEEGMFCGTGCLLVRPGKEIDSRFLTYHLSTPQNQEWIKRHAIGATMPNLNTSILSNVPLIVPSKSTQKAIAHILGSLDDKIELNRQMNETLEAMAQALFKSWFVDFDPVMDNALAAGNPIPDALKAKAEQRQQLHDTEAGQNNSPASAHHAHFPNAFEFHEDMGWIPEGWEISNAGNEFTTVGGATPSTKTPEFWDDGQINWTTPKDLSGNASKILLDTGRKITKLGLQKISSGLLPVDTVLMSSRAPVGYLALAKVPVAINQGYIAMKCDIKLTPEFAIQWAEANMDEIKQRSGGTTFSEISKKNFREIQLTVPNAPVINIFSEHVKGLYNQITQLTINIETLSKLRDTLLPKLLSGELRIPDAEKLIEESVS